MSSWISILIKMEKEKTEPVIPQAIKNWRNRSIVKKEKEIIALRLEIEKAKLEKELEEIRK